LQALFNLVHAYESKAFNFACSSENTIGFVKKSTAPDERATDRLSSSP